MPTPIRTLEQTIAWEQARLGRSRHSTNCDWSGGYNVDDCALFQAMAVFGSRVAWNVDVFMTLSGGKYHKGKSGLRRGDVVLYNWTGTGAPDHTEMCFTAPDKNGNFRTIGANGSDTIAVAYRTRNGYVQGYFRPAYKAAPKPAKPTTKPASSGSTIITSPEEGDMALKDRIFIYKDTDHAYFERLTGGTYKQVGPSDWAVLKAAAAELGEKITLIKVSANVYKAITGK